MRTVSIILACLALGSAMGFAACGDDDDDFSDIEGSATAARSVSPAGGTKTAAASPSAAASSTTASGGGDSGYVGQVKPLVTQLDKDVQKLIDDMIASQANQADPNTPVLLRADMQAVNQGIAALRKIEAPASMATFKADLTKAMDELERGTTALEKAVATGNQVSGATAFGALSTGQQELKDAIKLLPA